MPTEMWKFVFKLRCRFCRLGARCLLQKSVLHSLPCRFYGRLRLSVVQDCVCVQLWYGFSWTDSQHLSVIMAAAADADSEQFNVTMASAELTENQVKAQVSRIVDELGQIEHRLLQIPSRKPTNDEITKYERTTAMIILDSLTEIADVHNNSEIGRERAASVSLILIQEWNDAIGDPDWTSSGLWAKIAPEETKVVVLDSVRRFTQVKNHADQRVQPQHRLNAAYCDFMAAAEVGPCAISGSESCFGAARFLEAKSEQDREALKQIDAHLRFVVYIQNATEVAGYFGKGSREACKMAKVWRIKLANLGGLATTSPQKFMPKSDSNPEGGEDPEGLMMKMSCYPRLVDRGLWTSRPSSTFRGRFIKEECH